MAFFDATAEFDSALFEIELLTRAADDAQGSAQAYQSLIKAAIVLLATKIEAFAENIIEEYASELAQLDLSAKDLPHLLKLHSTVYLLDDVHGNAPFNASNRAVDKLIQAAKLWSDEAAIQEVAVNSKFNYGKHGSEQFSRLFERVAISNIYDKCQVIPQGDSLAYSVATRDQVRADIDSLTNIRNNIIHQDVTPGLTHQQVDGYRDRFWQFSFLVDLLLKTELEKLAANRETCLKK